MEKMSERKIEKIEREERMRRENGTKIQKKIKKNFENVL